jgi:hypothetical protein
MKGLVWATALLGAISALALVGLRQRQGALLINPPPAVAATARARCPDFTLEDNGVCLPLSRPTGATKPTAPVEWVSADDLISAFFVPWRDAPVSPSIASTVPADTRALLVRTRVSSEVRCAASFADPVIARVDKTPEGGWTLTLDSKSDATRTVSVTGLATLAPSATVGTACATGTPIATSGDALVVWGAVQ